MITGLVAVDVILVGLRWRVAHGDWDNLIRLVAYGLVFGFVTARMVCGPRRAIELNREPPGS